MVVSTPSPKKQRASYHVKTKIKNTRETFTIGIKDCHCEIIRLVLRKYRHSYPATPGISFQRDSASERRHIKKGRHDKAAFRASALIKVEKEEVNFSGNRRIQAIPHTNTHTQIRGAFKYFEVWASVTWDGKKIMTTWFVLRLLDGVMTFFEVCEPTKGNFST